MHSEQVAQLFQAVAELHFLVRYVLRRIANAVSVHAVVEELFEFEQDLCDFRVGAHEATRACSARKSATPLSTRYAISSTAAVQNSDDQLRE